MSICSGCPSCSSIEVIKEALKEEMLPKPGVLGVGVRDGKMLNVYVQSEEVIKTLPTLFELNGHRYLLFFAIGRIKACDAT